MRGARLLTRQRGLEGATKFGVGGIRDGAEHEGTRAPEIPQRLQKVSPRPSTLNPHDLPSPLAPLTVASHPRPSPSPLTPPPLTLAPHRRPSHPPPLASHLTLSFWATVLY